VIRSRYHNLGGLHFYYFLPISDLVSISQHQQKLRLKLDIILNLIHTCMTQGWCGSYPSLWDTFSPYYLPVFIGALKSAF